MSPAVNNTQRDAVGVQFVSFNFINDPSCRRALTTANCCYPLKRQANKKASEFNSDASITSCCNLSSVAELQTRLSILLEKIADVDR